ncbi:MAG TPA: M1 family aminopeptidase [Fimbriiglobus sp.]|jgi:aminopeptidase N
MPDRTAGGAGILAILGLLLYVSPAAADNYPRQTGVDAIHYVFRLTLSDDTDEIVGESTAELRFTRVGVTEAVLDLVSAANGKGMTVAEVTSAGKPVPFTHEKGRLRLTLDPSPKEDERRKFTVKYHGVPASGLRIGPNKYKERTFFSDNWPDKAHQWLPVIDHPYDKATSEFIVTAPAKYQVVANGLLQDVTDLGDGRRRTHWKQSVPIAAWLNALGVAQFAVRYADPVHGVPLQIWVFHQDRETGIPALEAPARKAIEFYSEAVGPFPYEKLANVQAAGQRGGMELASSIFYGERDITGSRVPSLVAHEIAHQWFGDSVTEKDWDDIWLSEGFATYFALLYAEHYDGRDAFVRGLKQSRDTVFRVEKQGEKRNPRLAIIHDNLTDTSRILNALVYQKGSWTLHMLRGQVGTDKFWAGIREYYKRYRDGNAATSNLRLVMEELSGQDLNWFFKQWLRRPGSPVVDGTWRFDAATKKVIVELTQKQPGEPYRLPLELGITQDGVASQRIVKIELTKAKQTFEIDADAEPAAVVLDPNTWVLMQMKFAKR